MSQWPKSDRESLINFYGNPDGNGDGLPDPIWESKNIVRIDPVYQMYLAWDPRAPLRKIAIHKNCADSLTRIMKKIEQKISPQDRSYYQLDMFGGAYNFRTMRGSNRLSMHAYGCAIDIAPEINPLGAKYRPNSRMMPMQVVRIFEEEGWGWGGEWQRPDAQHFEAVL